LTGGALEKLQPELTEYSKILVFMPSWIGDTVMALPALDRLHEALPNSRIEALARSWVAPLLIGQPALAEVLSYEAHRRYRGLLSMAAIIRRRGYDLALLLSNSFRSALLAFLGGAHARMGYSSDGRGWLLTHSISRDDRARSLHMVEYYLEILRAMGIEPIQSPPRLWINDAQRLRAAQIFQQNVIEAGRPLVGILPGAQNSVAKMWLPSRFARLADLIVEDLNASVAFFGGSGDSDRIEQVRRQMREPSVTLAGQIPLETLGATLERCRVFVTNDTGPMHVASAVGTPVVAIFGSTDPRITAPCGGPHSIIQANVPCAPCGKRECNRDLECMQAISTDDVLRAVEYQMKVKQR
jgi:heptosyltransferase-2